MTFPVIFFLFSIVYVSAQNSLPFSSQAIQSLLKFRADYIKSDGGFPFHPCPDCRSLFLDSKWCNPNVNPIEKDVCDALEFICGYLVCPTEDVGEHLPFEDHDEDFFSKLFGLRGYAWRGEDCDDLEKDIYPGRQSIAAHISADSDYNCNGIYGKNASGSFKELFCSKSDQMGVILVSDSTGAHFGPPIYPFGGPLDWSYNIENELDWPQCSWATGWKTGTDDCWENTFGFKLESFYSLLKKRNRCNKGDYQNISVDGARSSSISREIVNTTARNPQVDYPAIVLYSVGSNDVCNPHPGISHCTSRSDFYSNTITSLNFLNTILPQGSRVILIGPVHGRYIWEIMADKTVPWLGEGTNYSMIWEFITEHKVGPPDERTLNPCWLWLNPDPKWRAIGDQQAMMLDGVYQDIVQKNATSWKNFDIHYLEHPDLWSIQYLNQTKGADFLKNLYQPLGGGHPSQLASVLWGARVYGQLEKMNLLPPENPFNAEIIQMFGE